MPVFPHPTNAVGQRVNETVAQHHQHGKHAEPQSQRPPAPLPRLCPERTAHHPSSLQCDSESFTRQRFPIERKVLEQVRLPLHFGPKSQPIRHTHRSSIAEIAEFHDRVRNPLFPGMRSSYAPEPLRPWRVSKPHAGRRNVPLRPVRGPACGPLLFPNPGHSKCPEIHIKHFARNWSEFPDTRVTISLPAWNTDSFQ